MVQHALEEGHAVRLTVSSAATIGEAGALVQWAAMRAVMETRDDSVSLEASGTFWTSRLVALLGQSTRQVLAALADLLGRPEAKAGCCQSFCMSVS